MFSGGRKNAGWGSLPRNDYYNSSAMPLRAAGPVTVIGSKRGKTKQLGNNMGERDSVESSKGSFFHDGITGAALAT